MAGLTKKQQAIQAANSDLLTVKQFALRAHVSTRTISSAIDRGEVIREKASGLISFSANKDYSVKKGKQVATSQEVAEARGRIVIAEAKSKEAQASMLAMREAYMRGNTIHAADLQRIFRDGWSEVASQFHLQSLAFLQKLEGKPLPDQLKLYKEMINDVFSKVRAEQEKAWQQQARKQKKSAEKNIS